MLLSLLLSLLVCLHMSLLDAVEIPRAMPAGAPPAAALACLGLLLLRGLLLSDSSGVMALLVLAGGDKDLSRGARAKGAKGVSEWSVVLDKVKVYSAPWPLLCL